MKLFLLFTVLASIITVHGRTSSSIAAASPQRGATIVVAANAKPSTVVKGGKAVATKAASGALSLSAPIKLIIGALGIYGAFLYYGVYQEDVFDYKGKDGSRFKSVWMMNAVEALANVFVAALGLQFAGGMSKGLPLKSFALAGGSQVFAKFFTLSALAKGVSFPVVTLAKSGKMVPVMIGSILLGGAKYTLKEYASVAAIIAGTVMVSLGKKSSAASSTVGLACIALSLFFDGVTGGLQKQIKTKSMEVGVKPKPYDFMLWINAFMFATATLLSVVLGDLTSGLSFCKANPEVLEKILKFSACSAVGQSFIFFTIANFDPLVCTTITTTRKVFSVLLSIFLNGHNLSTQGWAGIAVASGGIMSEIWDKATGGGHSDKKAPKKVAAPAPAPAAKKPAAPVKKPAAPAPKKK